MGSRQLPIHCPYAAHRVPTSTRLCRRGHRGAQVARKGRFLAGTTLLRNSVLRTVSYDTADRTKARQARMRLVLIKSRRASDFPRAQGRGRGAISPHSAAEDFHGTPAGRGIPRFRPWVDQSPPSASGGAARQPVRANLRREAPGVPSTDRWCATTCRLVLAPATRQTQQPRWPLCEPHIQRSHPPRGARSPIVGHLHQDQRRRDTRRGVRDAGVISCCPQRDFAEVGGVHPRTRQRRRDARGRERTLAR